MLNLVLHGGFRPAHSSKMAVCQSVRLPLLCSQTNASNWIIADLWSQWCSYFRFSLRITLYRGLFWELSDLRAFSSLVAYFILTEKYTLIIIKEIVSMVEAHKRREFIKDRIYEEVKKDIVTFKYKPGEKLSEYSLSDKYQVSRSPIRSVFQKLESESLVVIDPQRGTFVTKLDYDYIQDIIYLRWCVEDTLMCNIISQKNNDKLFQELNEDLEMQKQLLSSDNINPEQFTDIDNRFHKKIYVNSGRKNLWKIIQDVNVNYIRFRMLDLVAGNSQKNIYEDHCKLVALMQSGEKDALRKLLKQHLNGNLQTNTGIKREFSEYFTI